jgi:tetratricopeptide (TPR) repeat protein
MARLPGWGGTVQRPAVINRPGNDNRPNIVNRPGVDNRGGIIRQPTIDRSRTVNQTNRINQNTTINQNNINRTRINNRQTVIRNQFLNNITVNRPTVHRHVENWTGRWDRYQSRWHPWYRSWHSHWHPYRSWGVPAVWAGGLWGLGSLYYTSGYYPYYNPYYVSTAFVTAVPTTNYALPLSVQVLDEPPQVAIQTFDAARLAFRNGDYPRALQMVNDALRDTPNDPALHEFRALTFFAMGRYQEASATLYAVLSVSSGWDWPTLYGLYPDLQTYEVQLRALERFRDANPNAAYARFYLAYLDKIGGYTEAAIAELRNVMTLQPQDQVAASMLASLQGEQGQTRQASEPVPPPEPPQELVPAPEDTSMAPARDSLVGSWIARRAGDNAPIRLTLTADNKFSWTFSQQERITNLEGTFSYDGGVLFLEQKDGAAMMGKLTARANGFNFKMVNAPANDPGLEFIRQ